MPRMDFGAYPGLQQSSLICTKTALPNNASLQVSLPEPCEYITIQLSAASAAMNVNFAGTTASAANYEIPSGGKLEYKGPAITNFSVFAAAATGTFSVLGV